MIEIQAAMARIFGGTLFGVTVRAKRLINTG